jgi:transposase
VAAHRTAAAPARAILGIRGARKRIPDRQVLCGILFVLHTGIQWEFLPQQLGFGSGVTCWRRLGRAA